MGVRRLHPYSDQPLNARESLRLTLQFSSRSNQKYTSRHNAGVVGLTKLFFGVTRARLPTVLHRCKSMRVGELRPRYLRPVIDWIVRVTGNVEVLLGGVDIWSERTAGTNFAGGRDALLPRHRENADRVDYRGRNGVRPTG
jgi:hypothetical protein